MAKQIVPVLGMLNLAHILVVLCLVSTQKIEPCDAPILAVLVKERTVQRCGDTAEKSDQFGMGRIMIDEFLHTIKYTAKGRPGQ
jgi:hypothetical protein